jgi:hypothetical protein
VTAPSFQVCQLKEILAQCRVLERAFGDHTRRVHSFGISSIESVLGELVGVLSVAMII